MKMRDRTFYRDGLWTGRLLIDFKPAEAWQKKGDFAMDDMAAIELGGDLDGQAQFTPRLFHCSGFGNRSDKVPPQT